MRIYPALRYLPLVLSVFLAPAASAATAPPEFSFTVTRFEVTGNNPLSAKQTQTVLQLFTGKHSGLEGLQAAADALQAELGRQGYNFHRVILPPQTLQGGVIRLQLVEFKLDAVQVKDNRYFDRANVLASLPPLKSGEAPNVRALSRALRQANAHPSRQLRLSFAESETASAINATVNVEDRAPGSFFTVLQNSGTEETGDYRLSLGYQYSNLFNRDHMLSLIYTTAPDDTDAVTQYGINYQIPLYSHAGTLSFLYSDSDVDVGTVQDFFNVSGAGTVIGIRYQHAFLDRGSYQHEVGLAYDDKLFENSTTFSGEPIGNDVRTNPLTATYRGRFVQPQDYFGFELGMAANQANGSDSNDAAYEAVREGADSGWSALRYGFDYSHRFGNNWSLRFGYKAQNAGEPLVSGEQFGIGGAQSVRGYEERELLGDNGWQANLEVLTRPLWDTGIVLLAFYDIGHVDSEATINNPATKYDIGSIGVGLRWSWRQQLGLRADIASAMDDVDPARPDATRDGDTKLHFSLFYRF